MDITSTTTARFTTLAALLVALALLIGGCTATPIPLPVDDPDGAVSIRDSGHPADSNTMPDAGAWDHTVPPLQDGAADAPTSDMDCTECPLGDGMLDGTQGDGATEAGPPADAQLADMAMGD